MRGIKYRAMPFASASSATSGAGDNPCTPVWRQPITNAAGKRKTDLSITHNSCADRGAQPDIGETGQAAPHHDVPRRRIIGAREVSA